MQCPRCYRDLEATLAPGYMRCPEHGLHKLEASTPPPPSFEGEPYAGGVPPHVAGSETSQAAALSQLGKASSKRRRVYEVIRDEPGGATDDLVEARTGWRHQTVSARRRELVLKGLVKDSGRKATTSSGRKATVWVVKHPPGAQREANTQQGHTDE